MTVKERYQANYDIYKRHIDEDASKYEWAADRIFDLVTYDGELDEMFVKNIIEVCKILLERKNFEYIEDPDNYIKLIVVCQILNRFNWVEWGTSIRGAWFEESMRYEPPRSFIPESRDILEKYEWGPEDEFVISAVPFTIDNLKGLIEFLEE